MIELTIESARCLRDLRDIPFEKLPHRAHCRRKQRKVGALPHVKTPRAVVIIFRVEDKAREIARVGALNPILFQRYSAVPFWRDIEKPNRIGPQQPFVTGGHGEIRLHLSNTEGQRTKRLREIKRERRAELTASLADTD